MVRMILELGAVSAHAAPRRAIMKSSSAAAMMPVSDVPRKFAEVLGIGDEFLHIDYRRIVLAR